MEANYAISSSSSSSSGLPPGFRFHPTDEELLTCYLISKVSCPGSTGAAASLLDVDLNRCEPWELPGKAKIGEKEWYFFSHRDRKYPTGVRTNRATKTGYWKTTGKDKEIFDSITSELIGMKKTLVFYRGRAPRGEKTDWVMHEFRLQSKLTCHSAKDEWVICRVFQKSGTSKKHHSSYDLGIGTYPGNPGSCIGGLDNILREEAKTSVVTLPNLPASSNDMPSILSTSPLGAYYIEEPKIFIDAQTNGQLEDENSGDLHAYWTSFLFNSHSSG